MNKANDDDDDDDRAARIVADDGPDDLLLIATPPASPRDGPSRGNSRQNRAAYTDVPYLDYVPTFAAPEQDALSNGPLMMDETCSPTRRTLRFVAKTASGRGRNTTEYPPQSNKHVGVTKRLLLRRTVIVCVLRPCPSRKNHHRRIPIRGNRRQSRILCSAVVAKRARIPLCADSARDVRTIFPVSFLRAATRILRRCVCTSDKPARSRTRMRNSKRNLTISMESRRVF